MRFLRGPGDGSSHLNTGHGIFLEDFDDWFSFCFFEFDCFLLQRHCLLLTLLSLCLSGAAMERE